MARTVVHIKDGTTGTIPELTDTTGKVISLLSTNAVQGGVVVILDDTGTHIPSGASLLPLSLPANILAHDFSGGAGPFVDFQNTVASSADYPADPTGSGRGTINRILYTSPGGFISSDQNMAYDTGIDKYRYNRTLWFKGDVYFPSAVASGGPQNPDNTRKTLDWFRIANARLLILREGVGRTLKYAAGDSMNAALGYREDIYQGSTGLSLADDTWYTLEVMMRTNTADNVRDGRLEIYVNNSSATPDFVVSTGLGWITENLGPTYFNSFRFGTQLTTQVGDPAMTQYRYWDNVAFSTTRIGTVVSNYTKYDTQTSSDLFTGTNGDLLENHTSDSGHVWYKQSGSDGGFALAINGNRLYSNHTVGGHEAYVLSQRPVTAGGVLTADYSVSFDMIYLTSDQTQPSLCARALIGADTRYQLQFFGGATNTWRLQSRVAGVGTNIGTGTWDAGAGAYVANQVVHAVLKCAGTAITATIDGTVRLSATDTAITAAGHPGVDTFSTTGANPALGQPMDNFAVSVP